MSEHPGTPEKKEVKGRLEDNPTLEPLPGFGVRAGWVGVDLYSGRLREALRFAEEAHRGQPRKGTGGVPYVLHPIAVAMILARTGADEELVIAGLLHDVAEDTSIEVQEIERRFGGRVAATVAQLTKASGEAPTPREVADMLEGEDAVVVKGADLIVNLSDILFDAGEQGSGYLKTLFGDDPAGKLRDYLELVDILVGRLDSCPSLRESLARLSDTAGPLLADLET